MYKVKILYNDNSKYEWYFDDLEEVIKFSKQYIEDKEWVKYVKIKKMK